MMAAEIGSIEPTAQEAAYNPARAEALADLRWLEWTAVQTILDAPPLEVPNSCQTVVVHNPR